MKENGACGRRYDREFKDNAVALVRGGKSISQVSRDLGVSRWSVGRWVQAATYIDTGEGWLYLAGILEACTRRLVGWQTSMKAYYYHFLYCC